MNIPNKTLSKYVFPFFVVCLSITSMLAQFTFWSLLFNDTKAILLTLIFETLRLSLLFFLLKKKERKKREIITLYSFYSIIACACFFAASHGLYIEEIDKDIIATKELGQELKKQVEILKLEYAKQIQPRLDKIQENITYNERKQALNPNSSYHKTRIEDWSKRYGDLVAERDNFLKNVPNDDDLEALKVWLNEKAPVVGIKFPPLPEAKGGSPALRRAIQEIWGVVPLKVKKVLSFILAFIIERGIFMLAFFGSSLTDTSGENSQTDIHKRFKYFVIILSLYENRL